MTKAEAIKLIDDRMCFGRGKWSKHHMPEIDDYWKAGQIAIKALEEPEVWTGKDEYAQGLNNQWHYDRNAIMALPSAQPEIIRCKDCKYAKWDDERGDYICNGRAVWKNHYCGCAKRKGEIK